MFRERRNNQKTKTNTQRTRLRKHCWLSSWSHIFHLLLLLLCPRNSFRKKIRLECFAPTVAELNWNESIRRLYFTEFVLFVDLVFHSSKTNGYYIARMKKNPNWIDSWFDDFQWFFRPFLFNIFWLVQFGKTVWFWYSKSIVRFLFFEDAKNEFPKSEAPSFERRKKKI